MHFRGYNELTEEERKYALEAADSESTGEVLRRIAGYGLH